MKRTLATLCIFASGFAALVYEICWIREAALVFGSTTLAVSTVLAAFFGGLAAGAWAGGRLGQRTGRPMLWYAVLEIVLALLALGTPVAFGLADLAYGAIYRSFDEPAPLLFALRAPLIAAVLLPPSCLMGATLPLFCRQFVVRRTRIAGAVGFLYGVNTLGAAAGCAATGFLLLPALGVTRSIQLAAAINVAAGLTAWALRLRVEPADAGRGQPAGEGVAGRREQAIVHGLFFLSGFVALGVEVMWTRFLGLVVRNTVHTYTITLTVVLLGIVIGSLLASRLVDRPGPRPAWFAALQVSSGLVVLLLVHLPPAFWQGLGDEWAVHIVMLLPAAVLSGAVFPLAVRMVLDEPALAAVGVGRMAAVNTLGGIAGALLVGFVGLPGPGLEGTALALSGLSVATGLAAWLLLREPRTIGWPAAAATACAGAWLAIPLVTTTDVPEDFLAGERRLVDFREGRSANLAVIDDEGVLRLEIDRWWQGENRKNHQIMAAHVPALLHPGPQRVLVVGAGTGQTPARFLLYDVSRLDCVDIEPALFDLIPRHFDAAWVADQRVRLIEEDGRGFVAHTDERYDIISLEVGQLFRPGVATFYTREFYRSARDRLRPGGLLAQFVPLPFLDREQLRRVLATFLDVFPASVLWYNTSELLVIGANADGIVLRGDRLRLLEDDAAIREDLRYSYWGGPAHWLSRPEVFLAGYLCGPGGLARLAGDAAAYRDDRPELEYSTSRVRTAQTRELELVPLIRAQLDPIGDLLEGPIEGDLEATLAAAASLRQRNCDDMIAQALLRQVEVQRDRLGPERIAAAMGEALRHNPDNVACNRMMAETQIRQGRLDAAFVSFSTALAVRPDDGLSRIGLGYLLVASGRVQEAMTHLEHALRLLPEHAVAHSYYGVALAQRGRLDEAIAHWEEALRLDPGNEDARANLVKARAAAGRR